MGTMVVAKRNIKRLAGRVAFLAGLALAVVAVLGWRMPVGSDTLALELRLIVNSTGELGVSPAGQIAARNDLEPRTDHDGLQAETSVTNQTGRPVLLGARALPSSRDLDNRLAVSVEAGGRILFRGELGKLRRPTRRSVRLRPGRTVPLTVVAWLPARVRSGYEGRIEDVTLELVTKHRGRQ